MTQTPESLRAFTARIAEAYEAGKITSPVHLSGGNEERLITYFDAYFRPGDWVFATWRSHYAALLAGVPEQKVYDAILAGRSITLCFPEYRFATSAIVGGHLPIALGVAMGIKRKNLHRWSVAADALLGGLPIEGWVEAGGEADARKQGTALMPSCQIIGAIQRSPIHVHVFLGDMASEGGVFHECRRYARGHALPITWIVEDNGLSVCTPTRETWGFDDAHDDVRHYRYELPWPHSGAKQRTQF